MAMARRKGEAHGDTLRVALLDAAGALLHAEGPPGADDPAPRRRRRDLDPGDLHPLRWQGGHPARDVPRGIRSARAVPRRRRPRRCRRLSTCSASAALPRRRAPEPALLRRDVRPAGAGVRAAGRRRGAQPRDATTAHRRHRALHRIRDAPARRGSGRDLRVPLGGGARAREPRAYRTPRPRPDSRATRPSTTAISWRASPHGWCIDTHCSRAPRVVGRLPVRDVRARQHRDRARVRARARVRRLVLGAPRTACPTWCCTRRARCPR